MSVNTDKLTKNQAKKSPGIKPPVSFNYGKIITVKEARKMLRKETNDQLDDKTLQAVTNLMEVIANAVAKHSIDGDNSGCGDIGGKYVK